MLEMCSEPCGVFKFRLAATGFATESTIVRKSGGPCGHYVIKSASAGLR